MKTLFRKKGSIISIAIILVAISTVLVYQTVASDFMHLFKVNENGQTYGTARYAITDEEMPDLIKAAGVDGTEGYVKKSDLVEEMPSTPEEALARQETRPKIRYIPLYKSDGVTVIGKFMIGGESDPELDKQMQEALEAGNPSVKPAVTSAP